MRTRPSIRKKELWGEEGEGRIRISIGKISNTFFFSLFFSYRKEGVYVYVCVCEGGGERGGGWKESTRKKDFKTKRRTCRRVGYGTVVLPQDLVGRGSHLSSQ